MVVVDFVAQAALRSEGLEYDQGVEDTTGVQRDGGRFRGDICMRQVYTCSVLWLLVGSESAFIFVCTFRGG